MADADLWWHIECARCGARDQHRVPDHIDVEDYGDEMLAVEAAGWSRVHDRLLPDVLLCDVCAKDYTALAEAADAKIATIRDELVRWLRGGDATSSS